MYCCCRCCFLIDIQLVNTDMRTLRFVIVPYIFLLPLFLFPHSLSVVNFPLCMAAAPQGNSNTNFANFDAFGNTAIPSHQSTSPPSKSFSSGTTLPAIFPSILSTCMHPYYSFSLFISHLLCPLGQPAVSRNALWMLEVFVGLCYCCYGYLGWAVVFIVLLSGLLGGHLEDACTGSAL